MTTIVVPEEDAGTGVKEHLGFGIHFLNRCGRFKSSVGECIANVDNLIRPKLVSKEAYLNFVLILLSALGGYQLFGFFGVIYGPVLMILFLTTIDIYQEHYLIEGNNQELLAESKLTHTESDDVGTHEEATEA